MYTAVYSTFTCPSQISQMSLAAPKIKQTKDPATCSKNNRGLPPIRGKSSPSQTAGSLLKKFWESGQDWPGYLAPPVSVIVRCWRFKLCCFGSRQKAKMAKLSKLSSLARSGRCKLLWTGLGITRPGDVPGQGVNIIQYVYVTVEITQGTLFLLTSVTCDSRSNIQCLEHWFSEADCKCFECTWFLQGVLFGEYVCTSQKGCWCHFRSKDVLTCTGPMDKRGAGREFLAAGKAQRSVASRAHVSRSWSVLHRLMGIWVKQHPQALYKSYVWALAEPLAFQFRKLVGCTVHGAGYFLPFSCVILDLGLAKCMLV